MIDCVSRRECVRVCGACRKTRLGRLYSPSRLVVCFPLLPLSCALTVFAERSRPLETSFPARSQIEAPKQRAGNSHQHGDKCLMTSCHLGRRKKKGKRLNLRFRFSVIGHFSAQLTIIIIHPPVRSSKQYR